MRKGLLFLLLAGAAMPAVAADERDDRRAAREAARAERAEVREQRQADRAQRAEPAAQVRSANSGGSSGNAPEIRESRRPAVIEQRIERSERRFGGGPALEPIERSPAARPFRPSLEQRVAEPPSERSPGPKIVRPTLEQRREAADSVREWRRAEREELRAARPAVIEQRTETGWESLRERRRETAGRDSIGNRRAPVISPVPREGTQPPPPAAARPASLTAQHWRGDWRHDGRYDWRKHRNRFRNLFHFGFYFDPFGWSYRPYSIGWRLWPHYYRSSYWLNDPWRYRLPYAPIGHRWIRYYDDLLLVDTWDGQVVDVIYNFFW